MDKLIMAKAEELAESLKDSEVYNRYLAMLADIKKDDKLYNRICEYRKENMTLMTMTADEWIQYGAKMCEDTYRDVYQSDIARDFLAAENELCTLLWRVKEQVYRMIDMDLDFLN